MSDDVRERLQRQLDLLQRRVSAVITPSGDVRLQQPVWTDLAFPATQGRQGANGKPDFGEATIAYLFPQNDTSEALYYLIQFPYWWKEGTDVYPHVHIQQTANQAAVFKMDYKWISVGDAIPAAYTTYTMSTYIAPYGSVAIHQIVYNVAPIVGAGQTLSSILKCKLYRDDNTFTGDLQMLSFDLHVQVDSMGSRDEYIK